MAVAETIVARADPYTVVIVPDARVMVGAGVFPVSVGQLARVEYAEVIPGSLRISPALSFTTSTQVEHFFVTSGSGNVFAIKAYAKLSGLMKDVAVTSWHLSSVPLYLKAWGR